MRRGIDPSINAIATILLGLLVCLVIASNIINRRKVK
jgi:ABC-type spermidine/putrescine transport system permease subunit II